MSASAGKRDPQFAAMIEIASATASRCASASTGALDQELLTR
jgi:hypothetical protein